MIKSLNLRRLLSQNIIANTIPKITFSLMGYSEHVSVLNFVHIKSFSNTIYSEFVVNQHTAAEPQVTMLVTWENTI